MEDYKNLIPANFRELFSFFAFLIGIIFSFISLKKSQLEHCLRMCAILFIVAVALFANNGYCYFGAIFIIATAVTQLDFLQNLAAIIRGSKEYFDYKKESKPTQEVENELERESQVIENAPVEEEIKDLQMETTTINSAISNQNFSSGQFAFVTEEYTFKFLEKKFKRPIQRYVRVLSTKFRTEFDGIMSLGDSDVIFEIKTTRRGIFPSMILQHTIERMVRAIENYKEATNRNATMRLILVGDFKESYKTRVISQVPELVPRNSNVQITVDFYSFSEIGLDIEQLEKAGK
jgi:hypothetical protein